MCLLQATTCVFTWLGRVGFVTVVLGRWLGLGGIFVSLLCFFLFHFCVSFSCCYLGTERKIKIILLQMSHKWQLQTPAVTEQRIHVLTLQLSKKSTKRICNAQLSLNKSLNLLYTWLKHILHCGDPTHLLTLWCTTSS